MRRFELPASGRMAVVQARPRRVLGPALARARELKHRECGAPLAIGYAVRFSDPEVMNARLIKPRSRFASMTVLPSPRLVLRCRFARLIDAAAA
jgi:hypothetical protein